MLRVVQIISLLLVAVALAPALAHVLEFPGKSRLDRDTYFAVQPIYYPGFTVAGGIGEAGGLISVILLLILTPRQTAALWWTVVALIGLLGMEIVFWLFTQPVNKFWLRNTKVGGFGAAFFSTRSQNQESPREWRRLRDRWEYSHIARAALAGLSFFSLVVASVSGA